MQLRIVTVPSASPERSAGYDASLGCPGAGPLLPGVPAIGPTSPGRSSRGQNRWTLRRQAFRRTTARDCTRQPRRARQLHRPTAGALAPSTFGDAEGGTRLLGQGVLSTVGGGGGEGRGVILGCFGRSDLVRSTVAVATALPTAVGTPI